MSNINEYYSEIRSDIAKDFGLESAGYAPRNYALTIRQCQILNNKYGFEKSQIIVKRYRSMLIANKKKGLN
jgi:hypothetical protein